MIHREKSRKRPEWTPGELANNQSTSGVSPLRAILTSGIFAERLVSADAANQMGYARMTRRLLIIKD
jgi:hypothetical protein